MSFEVICLMVSVVSLAFLYWVLDRRVTRLEKLASEAARVDASAPADTSHGG